MELTFLSGPVALTKTIAYNPHQGSYHVSAYPLVQKVTSYVEHVASIDDVAATVEKHAVRGHALLKGGLTKPLENESRAGFWRDDKHDWVVFDFDKVACAPTVEGALDAIKKYLPACCQNVDCLIQLSSSCYRPDTTLLSAHILMLLEAPQSSAAINHWIEWINFHSPMKDELSLTDSGMALHFPLDRSVNVPSKLIYVAPPRCVGFAAAVSEPFVIYDGEQRRMTMPSSERLPGNAIGDKINELRAAASLPERNYRTRTAHGVEIMVDAETCVIHDIKPSGEGYIRFNMNGGNSLAYYINLREPNLIGNHKGEPFLVTESVAPDLYKALVKTAKVVPSKALASCAIEPLAFYATNRGSQLYVGSYDRENDILRIDASTKDAAYSWLAGFGAPLKANFPHYDLVFDMTSELRFEDGYPMINLFRRTPLMKKYSGIAHTQDVDNTLPDLCKAACPVTYRVISSAVGDSQEAVTYFLNWLGAIFQNHDRTNSAWVLSGVEGTGKGFITNYFMRHLFGDDVVTQQTFEHVNDKFNEFLEGKLIVSLNEAVMSKTIDRDKVMAKLRDWITEPQIVIRGMFKSGREAKNYANFIVSSNDRRPVTIESHDRRWNVGEYQTERLLVTANELATVIEGLEMDAFAKFLSSLIINNDMLNNPYAGETKERVYEATHNLLDRVARAITEGDIEFFLEVRPSTLQMQTDFFGRSLPIKEYDTLIRGMMSGTLDLLTHEDLYILFRMVNPSEKQFPETKAAQRQIFQRYGLVSTGSKTMYDKRSKRSVRAVEAPRWNLTENAKTMAAEAFEQDGEEAPSNVRRMKLRVEK